ncbi:MAG: FkbM family methyltransferase [Gemmatimonadota bacterium]|nr:FkbM family methyltransferase [Gemmatimonadota bacterium]MDE3006686.1 FkbM family methyltransferase [Gemmatimonadota bacterium]MDE3014261.1 FkbM family methyltransferase [Gemmatimonadota bacterium]
MSIIHRIVRRIVRDIRKQLRLRKARTAGIAYVAPDFIYWPRIKAGDTVIDAGCSSQADFSLAMMDRYDARSYAVDPTRKHRPALAALEAKHGGKLVHLPIAIGPTDGELTFHESEKNDSGSLMDDHTNVTSDQVVNYTVRAVTLQNLVKELDSDRVAILKLDIEGAEYPLLRDATAEDLAAFDQIFIEFHHHAVVSYSEADTKRIADRIVGMGFKSFSLDNHNYLFWRA